MRGDGNGKYVLLLLQHRCLRKRGAVQVRHAACKTQKWVMDSSMLMYFSGFTTWSREVGLRVVVLQAEKVTQQTRVSWRDVGRGKSDYLLSSSLPCSLATLDYRIIIGGSKTKLEIKTRRRANAERFSSARPFRHSDGSSSAAACAASSAEFYG